MPARTPSAITCALPSSDLPTMPTYAPLAIDSIAARSPLRGAETGVVVGSYFSLYPRRGMG